MTGSNSEIDTFFPPEDGECPTTDELDEAYETPAQRKRSPLQMGVAVAVAFAIPAAACDGLLQNNDQEQPVPPGNRLVIDKAEWDAMQARMAGFEGRMDAVVSEMRAREAVGAESGSGNEVLDRDVKLEQGAVEQALLPDGALDKAVAATYGNAAKTVGLRSRVRTALRRFMSFSADSGFDPDEAEDAESNGVDVSLLKFFAGAEGGSGLDDDDGEKYAALEREFRRVLDEGGVQKIADYIGSLVKIVEHLPTGLQEKIVAGARHYLTVFNLAYKDLAKYEEILGHHDKWVGQTIRYENFYDCPRDKKKPVQFENGPHPVVEKHLEAHQTYNPEKMGGDYGRIIRTLFELKKSGFDIKSLSKAMNGLKDAFGL